MVMHVTHGFGLPRGEWLLVAFLSGTAGSACGGSTSSGPGDAGGDIVMSNPVDAGADDGEAGPSLVSLPLFSCVPSTYTAAVAIGGQQFQLAVDTGSTTLGVASSACASCTGVSPKYTPGTTAVDQNRQATTQYGTGSWSGEIYQDSVGAGSEAEVPVDLVAIDNQSQFFQPVMCNSASGSFQGILGLGPPGAAANGTTGYFDQLVARQGIPDVFATQLCDSGGTLWLGGFDPAATAGAPAYTPEIAAIDAYYYAVDLVSVTFSGTTVQVTSGQYTDSIVDTGTSVFVLPTAAFNSLTAAIAANPMFVSIFGNGGVSFLSSPNNCVTLTQTKAQLDAALPALTLAFGGNAPFSVSAKPTESYLISYLGQWCPALYSMAPLAGLPIAAILGSPVLKSSIVIFDRANKRIGFAPHAPCP
jgi:hypothetical protein